MMARDAWFREVYTSHLAYVVRAVRRLGVGSADVEDLVHDVFVAVYKGAPRFDRERPIKPWLFGIAYNLVGNYFAKQKRRAVTPGEAPPSLPSPADEIAAAETRAKIVAALATLELDQRGVIILHDLDGVSAPDIALTLGIPTNTVYSRLRAARQKLAEALRAVGALGSEGKDD